LLDPRAEFGKDLPMSEDDAYFSGPLPLPVRQVKDFMERRGEQLSATALRVLAREVILRVCRTESPVLPASVRPSTSEVEALCDALLSHDDTAGSDLVRAARLGGMPADVLYHGYICDAARRLGQRWDRDEATAAEVILGAGRIYGILRELRAVFLAEHLVAPPGAEAVFASVPGDVHGIGVTIAADTLRRKGWEVTLLLGLGHSALVERIAEKKPKMVCLSLSQTSMTFGLARLIVALRVRCPQVWVLAGGPVVSADPEVARIVDADAAARSISEAVDLLESHLDALNHLRSESG
jgi:MerR family transcriptional regulator, light-induced transcriptional regulator